MTLLLAYGTAMSIIKIFANLIADLGNKSEKTVLLLQIYYI